MKKSEVNPKELEKDMDKIISFINSLENLEIKDPKQLDKLQKQASSFEKILKNKYKKYLDDKE
tara:strand:- start:189 stop:377 length:189 start_codon:yes stop_codon:yes gene_type:complete